MAKPVITFIAPCYNDISFITNLMGNIVPLFGASVNKKIDIALRN